MIDAAIEEAERFIARARKASEGYTFHRFNNGDGGWWGNENRKDTAACKRASLDLTRALADMRRRS